MMFLHQVGVAFPLVGLTLWLQAAGVLEIWKRQQVQEKPNRLIGKIRDSEP